MDGHTGEAHVSSEDWAAFNEATYGASEAVLPWGDRFELSLSSASKGTVGTGAGIVCGRRFRVDAPVEVSVASGSQGKKRNDVVVARYAKTDAGVESVSLAVVKGEPGDAAVDPELQDGDLALWRVPLDGISVGDPVALFVPLGTIAAGLRGERVLWSGAWLGGAVSASLDGKISEQPNGAVLVFSMYEPDDGAKDWGWSYFFVPKFAGGNDAPGGGGTFFTGGADYGGFAKYFYVHDAEIVGRPDNEGDLTAGGRTYANGRYVLRYVLGV